LAPKPKTRQQAIQTSSEAVSPLDSPRDFHQELIRHEPVAQHHPLHSTRRPPDDEMTRPKVAPEQRQRTAQACESCKRRKQKVLSHSPPDHHIFALLLADLNWACAYSRMTNNCTCLDGRPPLSCKTSSELCAIHYLPPWYWDACCYYLTKLRRCVIVALVTLHLGSCANL
jgi:hypothetical protein